MTVSAYSLKILLILLVALCLPRPVRVESDRASLKEEITYQREHLAELILKLEQVKRRLDKAADGRHFG